MRRLSSIIVMAGGLLLSGCGGSPCTGLESVFGSEADRARCEGQAYAVQYTVDVDLSGTQPVMPRSHLPPPEPGTPEHRKMVLNNYARGL